MPSDSTGNKDTFFSPEEVLVAIKRKILAKGDDPDLVNVVIHSQHCSLRTFLPESSCDCAPLIVRGTDLFVRDLSDIVKEAENKQNN